MSNDLVKRLRNEKMGCNLWCEYYDGITTIPLCIEAVDRIEKLEAALKHCINALQEYEMGDDRPRGPIPNDDLRPWLLGAMDNAIKALEGKND